jgi:sterol desaturase/sphingolipid hydroxylase (fatty acid hydroxylase superfamily)
MEISPTHLASEKSAFKRMAEIVPHLIFLAMMALLVHQRKQVAAYLHLIKMRNIYLGLVIASSAFLVEAIFIGWQKSSLKILLRPKATHRRDLFIYFFDLSTVWGLLGKIFTFGVPIYIGGLLAGFVSNSSHLKFIPFVPSLIIQSLIFLFLFEFVAYWIHRGFHVIPFLWELHKYHHSAEDFCMLTARRDHPFVVPLYGMLNGIPAALFGAPTEEVVWITSLTIFHAMIIHSQIEKSWGPVGRWILVSPLGHRIHHSLDEKHFNKNFGFVTPFWDRVFGTFSLDSNERIKVGVVDSVCNQQSLFHEMLSGVYLSIKTLLLNCVWWKSPIVGVKPKP